MAYVTFFEWPLVPSLYSVSSTCFEVMNAYISNWFVLTQIFMLCLSYRPEAEWIQRIVDEISSDSSLIVYEDGQIGDGLSCWGNESEDVRFFVIRGWNGAKTTLFFFFGWNFGSTLIVMSTLSVDESADKNKMRVFWEGQDDSLFLSGPRFAQAIVSEKNLKL